MNEQMILLEQQNQCQNTPSEADGILCRPAFAADKLLENTLVFNTDNAVSLTMREREIIGLIVSGHTNKQIARRLSRSERTVEFHRNRLMRKLAAHNAAELVKRALVSGII